MKKKMFMGLMVLMISGYGCASKIDHSTLKDKLEAEKTVSINVSHLDQIESRLRQAVDESSDISDTNKVKIKGLILTSFENHKKLKIEEAKIMSLVLNKAVNSNKLSKDELRMKTQLKRRLAKLYTEKSNNIFNLIDDIKMMNVSTAKNSGFERRIESIMGDF
jgi:hypothetical protein